MTPSVTGVKPPGFRLPDATHVGGVRLQVADLARSISYYEKVLGLSVLERSETSASLGVKGDAEGLVELQELKGARPVPRRGLLGLYHFALLLPDRPSLGKFVAHLSSLGERAGMSDHLVSEAIYLTDPDGLGIEVYADRPASGWRVEDGQIAMATKPLDVDGLLAATGGESWSGAPRGTEMGHVHFHVGDIVNAEKFYHRALGLDKIVWGYPGALFMSAGGYHHHVGTNTWAEGAPAASASDARLLYWDLVLPDSDSVARAAESVESAGFDVADEGGIVTATDPWGIKVRLLTA